jgi:hypothetical protein
MSVIEIYYRGKEVKKSEEDIYFDIITHILHKISAPSELKEVVLDLVHLDIYSQVVNRMKYSFSER